MPIKGDNFLDVRKRMLRELIYPTFTKMKQAYIGPLVTGDFTNACLKGSRGYHRRPQGEPLRGGPIGQYLANSPLNFGFLKE